MKTMQHHWVISIEKIYAETNIEMGIDFNDNCGLWVIKQNIWRSSEK